MAVDAGANALGFNFYRKSPRYLTPERAHEIIGIVPGAYLRIGVFVNPSEEELEEVSRAVPLDVVQLHGDRCPVSTPLRVWRSIAPKAIANGLEAEAYLLDTPSPDFGGSGRTFDWNLAAAHSGCIILAGGLNASNVAEAIRTAQPWGVDACSRLESSPGKKDAQKVRAFVQSALASLTPVSVARPSFTGERTALSKNHALTDPTDAVEAAHVRPAGPEQSKVIKL